VEGSANAGWDFKNAGVSGDVHENKGTTKSIGVECLDACGRRGGSRDLAAEALILAPGF
jgi:hypothetical protein